MRASLWTSAVSLTLTGAAIAQSTASEPIPSDARSKLQFFWEGRAPLNEPLVTDRPDFTESADAVPRARLQLEVGYTYTHDGAGGGTDEHSLPETLLRIGVADGFELRLAWPNYVSAHNGDDGEGLEDFGVGFKVKLLEQKGLVPHFGVIGELSIPTGAEDFTSDAVDPGLKLLWAYDLTDRLSVAGNVNFASVTEDDDRFFQGGASLSMGISITDRIGTFFEYFAIVPAADGTGPEHYINGGATYLVNNNVQLDVRIGFGLNGRADDFFTGAGFAWRF